MLFYLFREVSLRANLFCRNTLFTLTVTHTHTCKLPGISTACEPLVSSTSYHSDPRAGPQCDSFKPELLCLLLQLLFFHSHGVSHQPGFHMERRQSPDENLQTCMWYIKWFGVAALILKNKMFSSSNKANTSRCFQFLSVIMGILGGSPDSM